MTTEPLGEHPTDISSAEWALQLADSLGQATLPGDRRALKILAQALRRERERAKELEDVALENIRAAKEAKAWARAEWEKRVRELEVLERQLREGLKCQVREDGHFPDCPGGRHETAKHSPSAKLCEKSQKALSLTPEKVSKIEPSILEELAELEHDRWSRWMKYLFTKGQRNRDGGFSIKRFSVEHWTRQMNTPYYELSDSEKESDRKEARNTLARFSTRDKARKA